MVSRVLFLPDNVKEHSTHLAIKLKPLTFIHVEINLLLNLCQNEFGYCSVLSYRCPVCFYEFIDSEVTTVLQPACSTLVITVLFICVTVA